MSDRSNPSAALLDALRAVERFGAERDWRGTDPYDGLNATRLPSPLRRARRGRQGVIQAVKRSPLDLRPLLGVPPARNSAAMAHVTWAYAIGGFLPEDEELAKLRSSVDALLAMRWAEREEACWGYHFDVQTRVFFYPRGAPNTIATSFAALALLEAHRRTGDERALEAAVSAGDWFLRHVPQTETPEGAFFGYLEGDRTPIHNANLLACTVLARLHAIDPRPELAAAVEAGVSHATTLQREDGSWPYGEEPHLQWVDGYHTGYVLWCLHEIAQAGFGGAVGGSLPRGLSYYRSELFLADGTPKFHSDALYPIDAECVAQGIQTFARCSASDPELLDPAWKVLDFALRRMRRPDGGFVYQRRRGWSIRTPHIRWVIASMLLALANLKRATRA